MGRGQSRARLPSRPGSPPQGLNALGGIPLRPDPAAWRTMQRRSFTRAATALVMAHRRDTQPESILKKVWRDDDDADVILRAASSPLMATGSFPQIQATRVLPMLAPDSASAKLLAMGANLSLDGIATIRIPYIGGAGRPAAPAFIAEGAQSRLQISRPMQRHLARLVRSLSALRSAWNFKRPRPRLRQA